jgi:D-alanyl-D-alanine carboxypeptidase
VKAAGYGVADRDTGALATPETVYRIASVSKQLIAAGVMLLVQEGCLGLDDPVARYVEGAPTAWDGITSRLGWSSRSSRPPGAGSSGF